MSTKTYNIWLNTIHIWLNTILTCDHASELVLAIVSPNGLPQMACPIWPSEYRRSGLQWLEMSPILCQWVHNDNEWYLNAIQKCGHACVLLFDIVTPHYLPQIYCLIWPPLVGVNSNSPWRHECALWCDHGYNANANLWALTSVATHSVLIDAIGFRSRFSQCVDYMRFNEK